MNITSDDAYRQARRLIEESRPGVYNVEQVAFDHGRTEDRSVGLYDAYVDGIPPRTWVVVWRGSDVTYAADIGSPTGRVPPFTPPEHIGWNVRIQRLESRLDGLERKVNR